MKNENYSLVVKTTENELINDMAIIATLSRLYDGDVDSNLVDKILTDIESDRNPVLYFGTEDKCKIGGKILSECNINFEIEKV
jgi:hypothetical protein